MAEGVSKRTWFQSVRSPTFLAMGTILFINVNSYSDRAVLSVLQEYIKADLKLSDFQLGLLAGPAFALLYGVLGIPLARLAERKSRKKIMLVAVIVWSTITMMCGAAGNFIQMFALRMGVGAAEAAAPPAQHSLIADYFPRSARGRAMSVLSLGVPAGLIMGGVVGGVVAANFGWRWAFVAVGLPGLLVGLIGCKSIFEAKRTSDVVGEDMTPISFWPTVKLLLQNRVFRILLIAAIITGNAAHAMSSFGVSYFMRVHELSVATAGTFLVAGKGVLGMVGALVAGWLSDKLDRGVGHDYIAIPGASCFLAMILYATAFYADGVVVAIFAYFAAAFVATGVVGPAFAAVQNVVHPRTRATAAAMFLFCVTVPGSLGPVLVGMVSDIAAAVSLQLTPGAYSDACGGVGAVVVDTGAGVDFATCRQASNDGLRIGMTAGLSLYIFAVATYVWAVREGRIVHHEEQAAKAAQAGQ